MLNGIALLVTVALFRDEFLPDRATHTGFAVTIGAMTAIMAGFYVVQERRRPSAR